MQMQPRVITPEVNSPRLAQTMSLSGLPAIVSTESRGKKAMITRQIFRINGQMVALRHIF
jgi:hypothetical protein